MLSVDPRNLPALTALDALYEKTGRMEEYLENLEHRLEVSPPEEDRVATYQKMATIWEENFAKPDRATEVLEKILLIDERNAKAYRDLERLYRQERKWESLVDTYRKHLVVASDTDRAHRPLHQDGPGLRAGAARPRPRHRCYNDVLSVEDDHVDALAGLARLYEETEQWDRAVDMMRRLIRVAADPRQKVDLNFRLGKIFDEQMKEQEPAEEYLVEALSLDPAHVPSMLSLLQHLQAARRLAEGGAADGPRRGGDQQPAGEDPPAVRGGQDLPGEAGRRGRRRSICSRASCSSIRSTSKRASRCRSSTSSARSGRRWSRSWRCWRARRIARPTAS